MRKSICSIVLGLLAAPAAAQPGSTPVAPQPPPPYPPPYAEPAQPPPPYPQPPPPYPQPEPEPAQPPPPMGATRATFVSMGEARWDVRLDGNAVCTTPCTLMVESVRFVSLHSQDRRSGRLGVGHLPGGDVLVQAHPREEGKFVAGLTFTTLAGMGLAAGISLTAVGCSTDRDTMCEAGIITTVSTGAALYLSIMLLRSALPRVHVGPAQAMPYAAGNTVGLAGRF
jgi:hypothetical protein